MALSSESESVLESAMKKITGEPGASATSSWRPAQMIPENPITYGTEFDRGSLGTVSAPGVPAPDIVTPGAAATDATATPYTAPAAYTAPAVTAAPAAAPAAAAAPQMISRAALYELQKQNAINSYETSKAQQIANLRSQGYSDRQLPTAPTNWGKVTQPANWGKQTNYMNTSMVENPFAKK
jgi:hypothetical protein